VLAFEATGSSTLTRRAAAASTPSSKKTPGHARHFLGDRHERGASAPCAVAAGPGDLVAQRGLMHSGTGPTIANTSKNPWTIFLHQPKLFPDMTPKTTGFSIPISCSTDVDRAFDGGLSLNNADPPPGLFRQEPPENLRPSASLLPASGMIYAPAARTCLFSCRRPFALAWDSGTMTRGAQHHHASCSHGWTKSCPVRKNSGPWVFGFEACPRRMGASLPEPGGL